MAPEIVNPDLVCRELSRLYQAHRMYPAGNEQVIAAAHRAAETFRAWGKPFHLTRMGEEVVVESEVLNPVPRQFAKLMENFAALRWESARIEHDIGARGLLDLMRRLDAKEPGPYRDVSFRAGSLVLDEGEGGAAGLSGTAAAGYLGLIPKVQEALADVRTERRGAWLRAREIVRTLTDHMLSGEDLFGTITDLKDYDDYTFTHALNVSLLSTAMARTMQLPERMVDAIGLGALCHDVGKERVPVEVLRKPSRLDDEEKAIMDRHPVEGAAKIVAVPGGVSPLVPVIAFEHHMRPDCSGYPRLNLPHRPHPASLLVSVADTFDALRTVRPYQQSAFTPPDAMSILLKEVRAGRMHGVFVSVFARLVNLIVPGRRVKLTDGREATVLAVGEFDALTPLVETLDREIVDLSMPGTPSIEVVSGMAA